MGRIGEHHRREQAGEDELDLGLDHAIAASVEEPRRQLSRAMIGPSEVVVSAAPAINEAFSRPYAASVAIANGPTNETRPIATVTEPPDARGRRRRRMPPARAEPTTTQRAFRLDRHLADDGGTTDNGRLHTDHLYEVA